MNECDPFYMIENSLDDRGRNLTLAIDELSRKFDSSKLRPIMTSQESRVVIDGLHILSELVSYPIEFIDLALMHATIDNWQARFCIANCLLIRYKDLSREQVKESLKLVDDEKSDVRCKMMEVLARLSSDLLNESVASISCVESREKHQKGLSILNGKFDAFGSFLRILESDDSILVCYSGAKILKLAISGIVFDMDKVLNNKYEVDYLIWRLKRIEKTMRKQ